MRQLLSGVGWVVLILVASLMTGCQLGPSGADDGGPLAVTPAGSGPASVRFQVQLDDVVPAPALRAAATVSTTGTPASVTFRLLFVNSRTSSEVPSKQEQVVTVDHNGAASATFSGVPLGTCIGQVMVSGGTIFGNTDYHGAIDLVAGANTLVVNARGSRKRADVLANVLQNLINMNPYVLPNVAGNLVAKIESSAAGTLTSRSTTAYYEVLDRFVTTQLVASAVTVLAANSDNTAVRQYGTASFSKTASDLFGSTQLSGIAATLKVDRVVRQAITGYGSGIVAWVTNDRSRCVLSTLQGTAATGYLSNTGYLGRVAVLPDRSVIVGGTQGGRPLLVRWTGAGTNEVPTSGSATDTTNIKWIQRFDAGEALLTPNAAVPAPEVEYLEYDQYGNQGGHVIARCPSTNTLKMFRINVETGAATYVGVVTPDAVASGTVTVVANNLRGRLKRVGASIRNSLHKELEDTQEIILCSNATKALYRGTTAADGTFNVAVPSSEAGSSFVISVVDGQGRCAGPVLMERSGGQGKTGLRVNGDVDLGTMTLPDDVKLSVLLPTNVASLASLIDTNSSVKLDANNVAVGMTSVGKGTDSLNLGTLATQLADRDKDGLIDLLDADDDGNGVVDEFESSGYVDTHAQISGYHVNFFMNLGINIERANIYYNGTQAEREAALKTDTMITFEVVLDSASAAKTITAIRMLERPGPAYLPVSSVSAAGGPTNWKSLGYAFNWSAADARWTAFVTPNALMNSGELFTFEVTFSDGSTRLYSRMINYVMKNIPKLTQVGPPGALTTFNLASLASGSSGQYGPLLIDGTKDLQLVFNPALDELGAYIRNTDYQVHLALYDATGSQIGDVNKTATWSPIPPYMDPNAGGNYNLTFPKSVITPTWNATNNTYSLTIDKGLFVNTVTKNSGSTVAVSHYKLDLWSEVSGGHSSFQFMVKKQ